MSISEEKVKELMVAFSPDGSGGELNLNEFDEMIDEFVQYKFSPDFFSGVPSTGGLQVESSIVSLIGARQHRQIHQS